jgi:hypothetical protein
MSIQHVFFQAQNLKTKPPKNVRTASYGSTSSRNQYPSFHQYDHTSCKVYPPSYTTISYGEDDSPWGFLLPVHSCIFLWSLPCLGSRDSAVSTVTGYGLDNLGVGRIGSWQWYITITVVDIIQHPVTYLKHNVLEIGFCLRLQVESTDVGPQSRIHTCTWGTEQGVWLHDHSSLWYSEALCWIKWLYKNFQVCIAHILYNFYFKAPLDEWKGYLWKPHLVIWSVKLLLVGKKETSRKTKTHVDGYY